MMYGKDISTRTPKNSQRDNLANLAFGQLMISRRGEASRLVVRFTQVSYGLGASTVCHSKSFIIIKIRELVCGQRTRSSKLYPEPEVGSQIRRGPQRDLAVSNFFPFLGFYAVGAGKVLGFRRKDLFQ